MPDGFKNVRRGTDAADMSDTATPGTLDSFLLDGEAPRLGSAPVLPPAQPTALLEAPIGQAGICVPPPLDGAAPTLPTPSLPTPALPTTAPAAPHGAAATAPSDSSAPAPAAEPRHPMAHLMPAKSQPSETSAWAAEIRAKQKAKARRTKIIMAVVFLAVCGVVGPPLGKWLVNAINESGSTKSDEPAATVPAATMPASTVLAAATATAPVPTAAPGAPATSAPAGLLGLPGQAEVVVGDVNAANPVAPATTVAP